MKCINSNLYNYLTMIPRFQVCRACQHDFGRACLRHFGRACQHDSAEPVQVTLTEPVYTISAEPVYTTLTVPVYTTSAEPIFLNGWAGKSTVVFASRVGFTGWMLSKLSLRPLHSDLIWCLCEWAWDKGGAEVWYNSKILRLFLGFTEERFTMF